MEPEGIAENFFRHKQRVDLLIEVGRFREALTELSADLARNPDDYYSLCQSSYCHHQLGEHQAAYDLSKKAVAIEPDGEWGHRLQSSIFAATGDNRRAHTSAEKCIELAPWSLACLETLLFAQIGVWRMDDAEKTVQKMLEAGPDDEVTHNAAGYFALKKEAYPEAEKHYQAVLAINPESVNALNNLGVIYLQYAEDGKGSAYRKRSADMFERAVRTQPTFVDGQQNLKIATNSIAKAGIPIGTILILCWATNALVNTGRHGLNSLPEIVRGLGVLTPYSPNHLIFGLNLLVIIYGILLTVFAIRYLFSKDRAAMIEPFRDFKTWIIIAIGTTFPAVFYIIFLVFLDIEANAFAFVGLLLFFGAALYANLQFIVYFQLRKND